MGGRATPHTRTLKGRGNKGAIKNPPKRRTREGSTALSTALRTHPSSNSTHRRLMAGAVSGPKVLCCRQTGATENHPRKQGQKKKPLACVSTNAPPHTRPDPHKCITHMLPHIFPTSACIARPPGESGERESKSRTFFLSEAALGVPCQPGLSGLLGFVSGLFPHGGHSPISFECRSLEWVLCLSSLEGR
jgi:hypothetical protein